MTKNLPRIAMAAAVLFFVHSPLRANRPYTEDVFGDSGGSLGGGATWQFVVGFLVAMAVCGAVGQWIGAKGYGFSGLLVAAIPFWAPFAIWGAIVLLR